MCSPLIAVLQASLEEGADPEAARTFVGRYIDAVEVNDHEFAYVAPNGRTFADDSDTAEAEVVGFGQPRPPWRQMAATMTGGKLGLPRGDERFTPTTIIVAFTPTTLIVA